MHFKPDKYPQKGLFKSHVSVDRYVVMTGSSAKYEELELVLLFKESKQLLEISFTFACHADNFSLISWNPALREF